MNIILIGYRGTGKSVISKILADMLHCRRYSLDEEIVRQVGKSVREIVEQEGWDRFREIEHRVVKQVSLEAQSSIIDCGGGVVVDERNVLDLRRRGKIVLLTSSLEEIIHRIRRDSSRPPLEGRLSFIEEQQKVRQERNPKYRAAADCTFETTYMNPREVAVKIINHFKKENWI
ncbi:uncharacterized protein METZ01_LOCUS457398 [marine metagenome]|uniref:Shikimate kinase n=1 Tax=marine metagenome TaxID=408172 RepID=A0A383AA54_9ZZZZ